MNANRRMLAGIVQGAICHLMLACTVVHAGEISRLPSKSMWPNGLLVSDAGAKDPKSGGSSTSSSGSTEQADSVRPVRDKWAVIIGITEFANSKVPRLQYATEDAKSFYQYLTQEANFAPDHVRLLYNERATQRRIKSELGNKLLTRMVKPDDLVVIFVSTHGSPAQMDSVEHKNYLVAYDSDPDDLYSTGIDMQEILSIIKHRVLSDRLLLILDACHSGGVDPNAKGIARVGNFDANTLVEGSGKMVICSSQPEEQSWESKRYRNGVFTRNLLDGLRSNGNNTTLNDAFKSAQDKIQDEVRQDHPGATQTPVLRSKWTGKELVLAVKPAQPEKLPPTVLADLEPDSLGRGGLIVDDSSTLIATSRPSKSIGGRLGPAEPPADEWDGKVGVDYLCKIAKVQRHKTAGELKSDLDGAFKLKAAFFNDPQYKYPVAAVRLQIGALRGDDSQFQPANRELQELLVDNPGYWQAYLARAYCFHKMKQEGQAQDFLRQAREHNPLLPEHMTFED